MKKMYKVVALSCTGVNGKVHHAKEELSADQLGGEKRAEELVSQKFLEAIKVEAPKENKKSDDKKESK